MPEDTLEQNVAGILDRCGLFADIPPDSFKTLVLMAQIRHFDKGRRIFRQGDACPGVYVVGTGLVRVFKTAPSGKEHVLLMVGPGNTFAEVAAIGAEAGEPVGSGYPSDPVTMEYIRGFVRRHRALPPHTRRSWETAGKVLAESTVRTPSLDEFGDGGE